MMAALLAQGAQVTWIQVPRPTFDLAGVLISSLSLTGIMAGIALALGTAVGITLIRRRGRESAGAFAERISLRLCPSSDRGVHLCPSSDRGVHLMADHSQS